MRNLVRQPLVHFIGAALFIFAYSGWQQSAVESQTIVISDTQIRNALVLWQKTWGMQPNREQLNVLLDTLIKDEVYYREALNLGLDQDDALIKRRLKQKLEFMLLPSVEEITPSDDQLKAYLQANSEQYKIGAKFSFEQLYFDNELDKAKRAKELLAQNNGANTESITELTSSIDLPRQMSNAGRVDVTRYFGEDFYQKLHELELQNWSPVVQSGFGFHLVRITNTIEAHIPALDLVKNQVKADFINQKKRELDDQYFQLLKQKYRVEVQYPETLATLRQ